MPALLALLAFFVGDWKVDATMGSQQVPFSYKVTALGPTFLVGHGIVPSMNLEVRDIWLETSNGGVVRIIVQSDGAWGLVRSTGWSGETLVLEGQVMLPSGATPIRETITRTGPTSFGAVWEAKTGDTWSAYSVEKLTR